MAGLVTGQAVVPGLRKSLQYKMRASSVRKGEMVQTQCLLPVVCPRWEVTLWESGGIGPQGVRLPMGVVFLHFMERICSLN